ncbi:MAG: hypothetical protein GX075_06350 [Firmicutes bacterium]|nr:hypothetical protein [Bacillota bacterium]
MFSLKNGKITVLIIILFLLTVHPASAGSNLLKNPGFEMERDGYPESWQIDHADSNAVITLERSVSRSGAKCVAVENLDYNDTWLIQEVKVKRNTIYRLSYWVKIDQPLAKTVGGANISVINGIYSSPEIFDTRGKWEYHEVYVRTNRISPEVLKVALRLGGYGAANKGKAYFDDVDMEAVAEFPPGAVVSELGNTEVSNGGANQGQTSTPGGVGLYILLGIVGLGIFVFVELKVSSKKSPQNTEAAKVETVDEDEL